MIDNTPQSSNEDQIFNKLDQEKALREIKEQAVKEAQEALISKLSGSKPRYAWEEKGKQKPDDYDDLFEEVDKRTIKPEDVESIVERRLKQEEERRQAKELEEQKQYLAQRENTKKQFDSEWRELIKENKVPAPSEQVQEKINKGEKLSKEDWEDEGMKVYKQLATLSSGRKGAKLAFYEDYNKEPAGKSAPVIGARPRAAQTETDELEYDDIAKNRRRLFGF